MTKNKSKQKVPINNKNLDDDNLLNHYILQNQQNANIVSDVESITPCAANLEQTKKKQLRIKLKNAIQQKNNMRYKPDKKSINEQTDQINTMMKHPKMTQQILDLYVKAISVDISKTLPTPVEIFDNKEIYLKNYYQYIIELLTKIKAEKLNINCLDKLLDNPYGHYMTKCLECPLNPFKK